MATKKKLTTDEIIAIYDLYFNKHHNVNDILHDDRVNASLSTIRNYIRIFKLSAVEQPISYGYSTYMTESYKSACKALGIQECELINDNDYEEECVYDNRTPENLRGIHESIDSMCGMMLELLELIKEIKNSAK